MLIPLTVTALILTHRLQSAVRPADVVQPVAGDDAGAGQRTSSHLLVQMGGLATAVLLLRNVRTRTRLVEVGRPRASPTWP